MLGRAFLRRQFVAFLQNCNAWKALITDWQTEAGAAYDEATKRVYFISCICCCLSSHPWAGTAFMHTASIPSQQQLAFLQDKGFRESQQGKQKLHVTSLSQHLWLSASCTHQCTQALRSAESRQNCMSYVAAASKHRLQRLLKSQLSFLLRS